MKPDMPRFWPRGACCGTRRNALIAVALRGVRGNVPIAVAALRDCALNRLSGGERGRRVEEIVTVVRLTASQTVNRPNVGMPHRECAFAGGSHSAITEVATEEPRGCDLR